MMPHPYRPALLAATATCLLAAALWLAAAGDAAVALPCSICAGAGETIIEAGAQPAARTRAFEPAVGGVEASTARSIDAAEAALARGLRGVGIASVLARLRDLVAAGSTDVELAEVRRRFVWLLRNDPAALPELEVLLADPALPPALLFEAMGAIGSADLPAAESMLAALLVGAAGTAVRVSAARALLRCACPSEAALRAAQHALADAGAGAELYGAGLLLLGGFARRDGALAEAAFADLVAREPFAREQGVLADWLEALGRSGRAGVAEVALRLFEAGAAAERAAAIAAVRKVDDSRLLPRLTRLALHDEVPFVRARAVEALAGRGAAVLPLLERILALEPDERVRTSALLVIAQRGDRAAAAMVLERVAAQDSSADLRRLAGELLAERRT